MYTCLPLWMCMVLQNVVDGDLCEQYASLSPEVQTRIAQDFEKTPADILKRLEDIRNRVL